MAVSIKEREPLGARTTFGVGGVARYFCQARDLEELKEALAFAKEKEVHAILISGGSNIVCSPEINALVIQITVDGIEVSGGNIRVGAGVPLMQLVNTANEHGLKGLESLAGIPGSVGGAIVGNAGAYGTEIGSRVKEVEVFDGGSLKKYDASECSFSYRNSIFKGNRELVVLGVTLELEAGDSNDLVAFSKEIVQKREKKYPPGLKCPGSFFKNQLASEVEPSILDALPERAVVYGKVAVGYLIEAVGGRGLCVGGACVADYHGNLLLNTGGATYQEVRELAEILRGKVRDRFGVELEEEIRYIA